LFVRTYVCMYACMFVHMHICMCVCMNICMHTCMYVCIHVCMYAYMYVCMHTCMYVCMYYAHTHTHTHIYTPSRMVKFFQNQKHIFHTIICVQKLYSTASCGTRRGCFRVHFHYILKPRCSSIATSRVCYASFGSNSLCRA
jgi:hypothetical protein